MLISWIDVYRKDHMGSYQSQVNLKSLISNSAAYVPYWTQNLNAYAYLNILKKT